MSLCVRNVSVQTSDLKRFQMGMTSNKVRMRTTMNVGKRDGRDNARRNKFSTKKTVVRGKKTREIAGRDEMTEQSKNLSW